FWTIPKKSSVLLDDGCHGFGGPVLPTISAFRRLLHHLTEPSVFVHSTRISSVGYPLVDKGSSAWIYCTGSPARVPGIKRRPVSPSVTLQQQLRLYVSASILKVFQRFPQAFGRFRRNQVCCLDDGCHGFGGPVLPNHFSFSSPASPPD
ncbi:hypothetical protein MRX96_053557, partial [Rhipicephalus microplus]